MMTNLKPNKGIAWRKVLDVGVIIHPVREIMIGLTEKGYQWWESILEGKAVQDPPENLRKFIDFLNIYGIFEESPDLAPPESVPEPPPEIRWVEAFQPLAFTRSCGYQPGGGGACIGHPQS